MRDVIDTRTARPSLPPIPKPVLADHHVLIGNEGVFQRRARLRQALWREDRDLPIGAQKGRPLGSRIEDVHARTHLSAFLTPTIRDVVREVLKGAERRAQLIDEGRLFANLLSSQPLCFNLFGELARDLDAATRVFRSLAPERVGRVTAIGFEHSPGRGDVRFTGDRSAFDVFVTYESVSGARGFLGVEVKYHEALRDKAASHRPRYDALADEMGCFVPERAYLTRAPLQQIFRDHLLVGAVLADDARFDEGAFVFLAPRDNPACASAVQAYRRMLTSDRTFVAWTLEEVVAAIRHAVPGKWPGELHGRYLDFSSVDRCIAEQAERTRASP